MIYLQLFYQLSAFWAVFWNVSSGLHYYLTECQKVAINTDRFQMIVWNEGLGFYYIDDHDCETQYAFFLEKDTPFGNHDFQHVSLHMNLLLHADRAPRSSQAAAEAARAERRARPSEMFTFQPGFVFNHTASCLTARSTAWPLFTSPCFRPALYAQSGRPRDDLTGSSSASQPSSVGGQAERKAAWRYTENAPVWLTQSA